MENYLKGFGKKICEHCNKQRTPEGHDGCIGTLQNVVNACCGHGETKMAYVQFYDERIIQGEEALKIIKDIKLINKICFEFIPPRMKPWGYLPGEYDADARDRNVLQNFLNSDLFKKYFQVKSEVATQ